jgi:hypothetical protein
LRETPRDRSVDATVSRETVELTAAVHPVLYGEFAAFFQGLTEAFREIGFTLRPLNKTMAEYLELQRAGFGDLMVGRWNSDYPMPTTSSTPDLLRVEELIAREALMLPLFYDQVHCFARPEVMGLVSVS